jgi:hypothetical protein
MSKAYIELTCKHRKYKLNSDDIGRLFKINKRRGPALPAFDERTKQQTETDDDQEVSNTTTL